MYLESKSLFWPSTTPQCHWCQQGHDEDILGSTSIISGGGSTSSSNDQLNQVPPFSPSESPFSDESHVSWDVGIWTWKEGVSLFEVQRRLGFCRQYVARARANIHQHPVIVLPTTRVAGCCRHRLVEFQSVSRLRIAFILRRLGPRNHSSAVGSPRWRVLQISASRDPGTPDTLWNGRNYGKRNMKKNLGFEPTEFGALKHGFRFPINFEVWSH